MKTLERIAILTVLVAAAPGCQATTLRYVPAESAPSLAPRPPSQVDVVHLTGEDWSASLPQGLMRCHDYDGILCAVQDYPTAANPHVVLGKVGTSVGYGGFDAAALDRLRMSAAEHGATTLFVVQPERPRYHGGVCDSSWCAVGVAVRLSQDPPAPQPEATALLAAPYEGFQRSGRASTIDLAQASTAGTVNGQRGTCYALAIALESDAELSSEARVDGVSMEMLIGGHPLIGARWHPTRAGDRHFVWNIGCPRASEPFEYRLGAGVLGRGRALLQLYARRAEVGERELDDLDEIAAQRRCERCREHLDVCLYVRPSTLATECRPFVGCLRSVAPSQCAFVR